LFQVHALQLAGAGRAEQEKAESQIHGHQTMTEEAAMYQVNGENHAVPITDINTLWIAGWMWGKYQDPNYPLPQDKATATHWLAGFIWGTTEACQYHRLWEWLDETLAGHESTVKLINRVAGNL
jgi:hypothetical protein